MVILSSQIYNWNISTKQLTKLRNDPLTSRISSSVQKAKWKPLKLPPSPGQDDKPKTLPLPDGMAEIHVTLKDLKNAGEIVPLTYM